MKNLLPLLLGLSLGLSAGPALARSLTPPRLAGRVLEASSQPLPGATVRLLHLPDSAVAAGTQTDAAGRYGFAGVRAGGYLVQATAVGQAGARSAAFALPATGNQGLELPDLRLRAAAARLWEVTVLGAAPAVEATAGKLVYNLDQRVSAAGTSAYEVLQRTPGVSTTQDDTLLPGPPPAGPPVLPPRLAGRWRQHEVAFMARRVLTAEQQAHLNDSTVALLNAQLRQGRAAIVLTLLPAGGYRYARTGPAGAPTSEAGTCRLRRDTLYLRPEAAAQPALLPPALRVVRLGRRVLVLEFPFGDPADKVAEQLLFRRE